MLHGALGLIETKGLIGAIVACDAAAKAAAVSVTTAELTEAALMTVKIDGELSAVQAAVKAGAHAAEMVSELVCAHVIPRPDTELNAMMPEKAYISKYHPDDDRPPFYPDAPTRPKPPRAPVGAPDRVTSHTKDRAPEPAPRVTEPKVVKAKPPLPKKPTPPPPEPAPAPPETDSGGVLSIAELEKLPVVKLRRYARTLAGLPIKGRQISMANKQVLLEVIRTMMDQK